MSELTKVGVSLRQYSIVSSSVLFFFTSPYSKISFCLLMKLMHLKYIVLCMEQPYKIGMTSSEWHCTQGRTIISSQQPAVVARNCSRDSWLLWFWKWLNNNKNTIMYKIFSLLMTSYFLYGIAYYNDSAVSLPIKLSNRNVDSLRLTDGQLQESIHMFSHIMRETAFKTQTMDFPQSNTLI